LEKLLAERLSELDGRETVHRAADDVFGVYDLDGDGAITREEWAGTDAVFSALDVDGDGRVTPAELAAGIGCAHFLTDPDKKHHHGSQRQRQLIGTTRCTRSPPRPRDSACRTCTNCRKFGRAGELARRVVWRRANGNMRRLVGGLGALVCLGWPMIASAQPRELATYTLFGSSAV